jgi:hypothetical protein
VFIIIEEQPIVAKDSSVKLQATPLETGEDSEHEESSRLLMFPYFDANNSNHRSDDIGTC